MKIISFDSPIGVIRIGESSGLISNVFFECDVIPSDAMFLKSDVLLEARTQMQAYFSGKLETFSLPLFIKGGVFFREVLRFVMEIPYGETASYAEVAKKAGNCKAFRAVGMASGRNPLPVIIPCHRVIGSGGKLTGYRGGLEAKKYLLDMEKGNRAVKGSV